jgi:hypothetical protein
MQVFKCTKHDQVFFLPLILVIFSCFLCFYVLHLYFTFIIGFPKAMTPLQVLKNFKFKFFLVVNQMQPQIRCRMLHLMYKQLLIVL